MHSGSFARHKQMNSSRGSLFHQNGIEEALVVIIFLSPPTLPGTLPSTEKVPSSCFWESLFGVISLANPF
jgi:hypothetical protein